jgi:hypothetical protein
MDDLDPAKAENLDDLAACLKQVHLRADKPTLRALDQQSIHASGFLPGAHLRRVRLTRTTLGEVLAGRKFPGKAFLLTFVEACGVDLDDDPRWEQAWDRLAPRYEQVSSPRTAELERLRRENEDLLKRMAGLAPAGGAGGKTDNAAGTADGAAAIETARLARALRPLQDPEPAGAAEQPRSTDYYIARARPYADRIWARLRELAAQRVTSPSGAEVFPNSPQHARAWDTWADSRSDHVRIWLIAITQMRDDSADAARLDALVKEAVNSRPDAGVAANQAQAADAGAPAPASRRRGLSAMRKMAIYLGLVEDDHLYEDMYDPYEEVEADDENG